MRWRETIQVAVLTLCAAVVLSLGALALFHDDIQRLFAMTACGPGVGR